MVDGLAVVAPFPFHTMAHCLAKSSRSARESRVGNNWEQKLANKFNLRGYENLKGQDKTSQAGVSERLARIVDAFALSPNLRGLSKLSHFRGSVHAFAAGACWNRPFLETI